MRLALTLVATVATALTLAASTTNAAPPASEQCPAAFQLKPLSFFVEEFGVDVSVVDMNENQLVCFILLPEHSPRSPIFANVIDDVAFAKRP